MEYQKRADQPDYKTGKDLAQGVMPQHNPRRAQYACNQNKQAQPHYRIIAEQRTERNQSADNTAHPRHVFAQFPFQIDQNADDRYHQGNKNDSGHIPGNIQFPHHQQAEHIRNDSQQDRYITFLTLTQFLTGKPVDLPEQENGDSGRQYGEAVNDSQHNSLIKYRHDTEIRKQE